MDTTEFSPLIALTGNRANAAEPRHNHSLPAAVISVRDTASSWLFARMKEVFAGIDDSLFAAAEKAHAQEEQDGLFQALRLLRLERAGLTDRFVSAVQRGFTHGKPGGGEAESEVPPSAQKTLSLVQNDDLEQQVALKSIISAVKRDSAASIAALALRLDTLLPARVCDENMALSPARLCRAFEWAFKPLDIHLRARLTVLKKFEQLLAVKLEDLYQGCNQLLAEKGILPDLRDPLLQRRVALRPAAPASWGEGGTPRSGAQNPEVLPSSTPWPGTPLAGGPLAGAAGVPPAVPGPFPATAATAGGYGLLPPDSGAVPLGTPDLLQYLGALQVLPLQADTAGRVLDVNSLLQQRLMESRQSASLQELDSEVIRMVDLLFSFMLEDRNLAEPIKVQLIRLQLPLLKLAVADKSFFGKGGHPARKLFNALADAAIGWQPGDNYEHEPFYREVCGIVERVLQEFQRDESIFDHLLQSFEEFIDRERRRAEIMERRTLDEAQGSARIEAGKARVAAVFDALTAERKLPMVAREWLERVWHSVLLRTCFREGTASDDWRRHVLTARDLVWSLVAPMPESRFKMRQLLPGLRKRLDEGARSLSLSAGDRQRLMQGLDALYREREAFGERLESERERRARERLVQELRREADSVMRIPAVPGADEVAEVAIGEMPGVPDESRLAGDMETLDLLDRETDLPELEVLQQLAEAAPAAKTAELEPLADSDEHWRQTYYLKYSWFMLHRDDKRPVRCRLAAIIKELDQFMFVNRAGAKVGVYSRLELAHALRSQVITPLDKGPLFERALKHVVGAIGETRVPVSVAAGE